MLLYEKIFTTLNQCNVNYLVVGGVAVALHGFVRATADIDLLLSMDDANIANYITAVKKLHMVPRVPVALDDFADKKKRREWVKEKNMVVFPVYKPDNIIEHIDVLLCAPIRFAAVEKRKSVMKYGKTRIYVASLNDLVRMKKHSGREMDQIDIAALQTLRRQRHGKTAQKRNR